MSEETAFSRNYRDLSRQRGTDAGFQFEFSCTRCRDTWRSPFEPYNSGRAAGWLQRSAGPAGRLLGGSRNGYALSRAADGLAGAGWGSARDAAFQRAVAAGQQRFKRCARCTDPVCGQCWNEELGLCMRCAPDTAAEVGAARQRGLNQRASQRAQQVGESEGDRYDVDSRRQLVCPNCATQTSGAAFCPGCGHRLGQQDTCSGCRTALPTGAAFCPGCGQRRDA